jgi:CTP-dependent riboflavin kinase
MAEVVALTGIVRTGLGRAAADMGPWVDLPFDSYPGTLNVELGEETVEAFLRTVIRCAHYRRRWYPYRFGSIGSVPVAVTDSQTEFSQVEVIAPVRLRDLPLEDGDTVTIVLAAE